MNRTKIVTLIFSLSVLIACGNSKKNEEAAQEKKEETKAETLLLKKEPISTDILLPGELSAFRQVDLYAKINSYVKTLKTDIGSEVKSGQLLIELEAPEIMSQRVAAESKLRSQEAIYEASNSTYQRLYQTSKVEGTISKNDLEQAQSKKNSDYAQLEAARAARKEIAAMQSYLQIRAPFEGKVTTRSVNIGAYVGQGSQSPLLTVQDTKNLRLSVSVPATYAGYLSKGDELKFKVASLNETFKARISRMSGALDSKLRSEKIELDVKNTDGKLLPGMVAEVSLSINSKNESFAVPHSAIIHSDEGIYVVKILQHKARRVPIETGIETDDKAEIYSSSLHQNDVLMSNPGEEIKDGATIK
jgi:RND family efflux transporter MFP subunit